MTRQRNKMTIVNINFQEFSYKTLLDKLTHFQPGTSLKITGFTSKKNLREYVSEINHHMSLRDIRESVSFNGIKDEDNLIYTINKK